MSKMEYMPVDCLQVPKMLFQVEEFKNLSNTAKILYSLFLDRLKFAVQNGWVDHNGDLFVIYPKSEMKKDLNTTRYGVDQAVQELVKIGKLVRIVQNDGKANHFYINDIYENEMEEESMMTLDRIMANMQMEEREIIMDKMVKASRDILGTIADMGYLDEYETPLTPIPNSINRLENFPLNANGKVDRRRLAEYQKTDSVEIMSDKVLNIVLMIWEELLKNKVADLDENLFKIGADSLLAARFVAAINARCGIEVRMKEVFMNPSINALTKLVDKRKNTDIAEFVEEGEI